MKEWIESIIVSIVYWSGFFVTYSHNAPKDNSLRGWAKAGFKAMLWLLFLPIDIIKWRKR